MFTVFMPSKSNPVFDEDYYRKVIEQYGYDPLRFGPITFSLAGAHANELQSRWVCHFKGNDFAQRLSTEKSVVLSGVGLSSVPHIGTLTQILNMKFLHDKGVPVEFVLGDLDAFNGKNIPFSETRKLAERYKKFISALGFVSDATATIRDQWSRPDVARSMYVAGHYMDDAAFDATEEDLHDLYVSHGKVDAHMSFRRKLSLALMTADFVDLLLEKGYTNVLVTLGIDEHRYVLFAQEVVARMSNDGLIPNSALLASMYSPLISGFNGFPKMSKSFPQSSIHLGMSADEIVSKIVDQEGEISDPLLSPVYQMMLSIGGFSAEELVERRGACLEKNEKWATYKIEFAKLLSSYAALWQTA